MAVSRVRPSTPTRRLRRTDFKDAKIHPVAAFYSEAFSNFLLPYDDARAAANPRATVLEFLQSTYEAAANLGQWDRKSLERDFSSP